ncbi:MAG: glycoside hydrolase family 25 protein [Bacteroidaceae bacterium]|nr:glycoside hydrolase family 25 protein [Bacteroidaceae bacterium]
MQYRKNNKQASFFHWRKPPVTSKTMMGLAVLVFCALFYYFFLAPYIRKWKYIHTEGEYGVFIPDGYTIYGIDISHYQKDIDWDKMVKDVEKKEYPLKFIFVKATEGENHHDELFIKNFDNARKYGFIRGAYHFYIPSITAEKQAKNFIKQVQLLPGDLPPVLDVEATGGKSKKELKREIKRWLSLIEKHYNAKPIIYASLRFKENYLSDDELDNYPLWIAHYYVDSVQYKGSWHFWQNTDMAKIPGIDPYVDLNIFHGTMEELTKLTIK